MFAKKKLLDRLFSPASESPWTLDRVVTQRRGKLPQWKQPSSGFTFNRQYPTYTIVELEGLSGPCLDIFLCFSENFMTIFRRCHAPVTIFKVWLEKETQIDLANQGRIIAFFCQKTTKTLVYLHNTSNLIVQLSKNSYTFLPLSINTLLGFGHYQRALKLWQRKLPWKK